MGKTDIINYLKEKGDWACCLEISEAIEIGKNNVSRALKILVERDRDLLRKSKPFIVGNLKLKQYFYKIR